MQRTIGKALDVMTAAEVLKVASITQSYMDLFGYKLVCREDDVRVDVDRVVPGLFSLEAAAWPPASLEKKASSPSTSETAVGINNFFTVRSNDDKFGRKITDLRKAFTQNDTKPFQVS
ncbi:hypothetical protein EON64_00660 [archaeon]|nr:MAG: hypothetical protein EON64_00660 [archaeon]